MYSIVLACILCVTVGVNAIAVVVVKVHDTVKYCKEKDKQIKAE